MLKQNKLNTTIYLKYINNSLAFQNIKKTCKNLMNKHFLWVQIKYEYI